MAIKDVESKCWILALFVRDDGERFLLGDGSYEFNEKQLHFVANTMANDVIEVQGNDGYLLAGQVRRPSTQSFDGYIGDSATSKVVVEQRRRAFFEFFRKNFFYNVIYVFPDGSAIQRKRGFLVDAPEVKELYQIYPEYHVAFNFEDINYYHYDEDSDGKEIYGESATIRLNSGAQGGGLVWLPIIEGTLSGEGIDFTLYGTSPGMKLNSAELKGDVIQDGVPTPSSPITIQTATDRQMITISDGDAQNQEYEINLGKNLFNFGQFYANRSSFTTNEGTVNITSNSIEYAGHTSTGSQWYPAHEASNKSIYGMSNLQPNTTYTISYKATGDTQCWVFFFNSSNTRTSVQQTFTSSTVSFTFTTPADLSWYAVRLDNRTTSNTISDIQIEKGSTATTYATYFEPIELCKIGTYQDYIYKSGNAWYVHKKVRHLSLAIADMNNSEDYPGWKNIPELQADLGAINYPLRYSTTYKSNIAAQNVGAAVNSTSNGVLFLRKEDFSLTQTQWKTKYPDLTFELYYGITTTQADTQITDATLINQLEALVAATTYDGTTSFSVDGDGNLAAILAVEVDAGGDGGVQWDEDGAVWEEGGSSSNVIMVDSIDNVYPALTIAGRTVNPVITDVATGMIFRYSGTITESQTLIVDMMNKTATLNGVSVVGNITGDWLYLAPGNNRITYTADNTNAPSALLEWQEIVG